MHIFVLACTTGLSDVITITVDLTVCNDAYQPLCGTPAIWHGKAGGSQHANVRIQERLRDKTSILNTLQDLQRPLLTNLQTIRSASPIASGRTSPLSCDINEHSEIR